MTVIYDRTFLSHQFVFLPPPKFFQQIDPQCTYSALYSVGIQRALLKADSYHGKFLFFFFFSGWEIFEYSASSLHLALDALFRIKRLCYCFHC